MLFFLVTFFVSQLILVLFVLSLHFIAFLFYCLYFFVFLIFTRLTATNLVTSATAFRPHMTVWRWVVALLVHQRRPRRSIGRRGERPRASAQATTMMTTKVPSIAVVRLSASAFIVSSPTNAGGSVPSKKILHYANVSFSAHAIAQPCRHTTRGAFQALKGQRGI